MIKITIQDLSLNLPLPKADIILKDVDQYVFVYDQIVKAIHNHQNLEVVVTEKKSAKWLSVLQRRYGDQHVIVEEVSLKKQLSKQIGVLIPDTISDQQIINSKLLDLSIPASTNIAFEDYLLEVFFGNFLVIEGGMRRVGDMCNNYDPDHWNAALDRPLVKELYLNRIRSLRSKFITEKRLGEKLLLDWLEKSPEILTRNLSSIKLINEYPELLGYHLFGNDFPKIRELKLDLRKVPIIVKGNERTIDEIRIYLTSKKDPEDIEEFTKLIDEMSGFLEIEFSLTYQILQNGQINVDQKLVEKIKSKFKSLHNIPRIAQLLSDVDLLITRPKPIEPQPNWAEEDWVKWATESYLPYRFWLENSGQLDDEIAEFAGKYSDWLNSNYGNLKYHSKRMAWKWLLNISEKWKQTDDPVLVVMVDNLNAKFYPDLLIQLQTQGFYEQQMNYCFSMLPSCTEVSKKSIITGHYQPFQGTAYKSIVESTWKNRMEKRVLYVSNIGEFRTISKREHDIYFLNYLPLDISLHQNENQTGISHTQAIRNFLTSLSHDIRVFAEKIGAERDLTLIIISDHGSTRIPKGTINVIQGDFYRKRAIDEHHRYIAMNDTEIQKLPENYKYDCYLLNKEVMELDTNYLIARRLYRFLPTDESAYIHGGFTPEETLIPAAIFQPVIISPKALVLTNIGSNKIYVGTKFDFSFDLTNLNNYPCENCVMEIFDPNFETKKVEFNTLGKLMRLSVSVPSRCVRNAETGQRKVQIKITFEFLGQLSANEFSIPFEIIEPAKPKFDLDNL